MEEYIEQEVTFTIELEGLNINSSLEDRLVNILLEYLSDALLKDEIWLKIQEELPEDCELVDINLDF